LRISYIAGTLSGLNARGDSRDDIAMACGNQLGPDAAGAVQEAIADKNIVCGGVFLEDALAQSVLSESLLSINAVVDGGTIRCSAEAVLDWTHFRQRDRQQRL